jgi:transcriptional regulator with XRE-family HTH domain
MAENPRAVRRRVGRNIRRLRLLHGLSQERLAEAARRDTKHVGEVERGRVDVGLDFLASIAATLSIPLADLVGPGWPSQVCVMPRRDAEQVARALRIVVEAIEAAQPRTRARPARVRNRSKG